jgi:hypothetical protein
MTALQDLVEDGLLKQNPRLSKQKSADLRAYCKKHPN